jgi:hypothetical protein
MPAIKIVMINRSITNKVTRVQYNLTEILLVFKVGICRKMDSKYLRREKRFNLNILANKMEKDRMEIWIF